jgi:hypothetical protein
MKRTYHADLLYDKYFHRRDQWEEKHQNTLTTDSELENIGFGVPVA